MDYEPQSWATHVKGKETGENEPFIYRGRTFVPLRLVSELFTGRQECEKFENKSKLIRILIYATPRKM